MDKGINTKLCLIGVLIIAEVFLLLDPFSGQSLETYAYCFHTYTSIYIIHK